MQFTPGFRVGAYEVIAPIAAGGMGEVYRARDTRLGRDVALKVLTRAASADPERQARFEREARAVAALSHPNILASWGAWGTCPPSKCPDRSPIIDRMCLRLASFSSRCSPGTRSSGEALPSKH
jgi:serine/threonine protein kinase